MIMIYGPTSTADGVLDGRRLTGKRILVTGVSSGVCLETARALASHGAIVVGAVRDLGKGAAAMGALRSDGSFRLVELDLSSLESVRTCSAVLLSESNPFDLIIANAGVMAVPFGLTVDGFETHFATNYLGHFLLVNRIAPLLRGEGRVVMVSSAGHRGADVDLDDPNFASKPYDPLVAYRQSKTATILFAVEFDRRKKSCGIRAAAVHPGAVLTEPHKNLSMHKRRRHRFSPGRPLRRVRRRRYGPAASRLRPKSAAIMPRIVALQRSTMIRSPELAFAAMHWILRRQKHCGMRARRWWVKCSSTERCRSDRSSLTHIRQVEVPLVCQ